MKTINERIGHLISILQMNKNSFAKRLNHTNSTIISNIVGGRKNNPSFDVIYKIITTFDVNANWLITGNGEVFLNNNKSISVVNEPMLKYNEKCYECERKQEVIDMQMQRILSLNMVIDAKNEVIEILKGDCNKQTKAG